MNLGPVIQNFDLKGTLPKIHDMSQINRPVFLLRNFQKPLGTVITAG